MQSSPINGIVNFSSIWYRAWLFQIQNLGSALTNTHNSPSLVSYAVYILSHLGKLSMLQSDRTKHCLSSTLTDTMMTVFLGKYLSLTRNVGTGCTTKPSRLASLNTRRPTRSSARETSLLRTTTSFQTSLPMASRVTTNARSGSTSKRSTRAPSPYRPWSEAASSLKNTKANILLEVKPVFTKESTTLSLPGMTGSKTVIIVSLTMLTQLGWSTLQDRCQNLHFTFGTTRTSIELLFRYHPHHNWTRSSQERYQYGIPYIVILSPAQTWTVWRIDCLGLENSEIVHFLSIGGISKRECADYESRSRSRCWHACAISSKKCMCYVYTNKNNIKTISLLITVITGQKFTHSMYIFSRVKYHDNNQWRPSNISYFLKWNLVKYQFKIGNKISLKYVSRCLISDNSTLVQLLACVIRQRQVITWTNVVQEPWH